MLQVEMEFRNYYFCKLTATINASSGNTQYVGLFVRVNGEYNNECSAFRHDNWNILSKTNESISITTPLYNRCYFNGDYNFIVGVKDAYGDTIWAEKRFKLGTEYHYPGCLGAQKNYPIEHHYMQAYQITNSPKYSDLTFAYNQANLTIQLLHVYPELFENLICNGTEENAIEVLRNYFGAHHINFNVGYLASIKLLVDDPEPNVNGRTLYSSGSNHSQTPSFIYTGRARENAIYGEEILIASTIHELAHQIAVMSHSDHNSSCCVISKPWPGTCNYSSFKFCDFHKCLLYNFTVNW